MQGVHKFCKILGPLPKSMHQKGDMKQVPYWESKILYWPVNHIVILHFLLSSCQLIQISECKEKCNNYADNIWLHLKKISCPRLAQLYINGWVRSLIPKVKHIRHSTHTHTHTLLAVIYHSVSEQCHDKHWRLLGEAVTTIGNIFHICLVTICMLNEGNM